MSERATVTREPENRRYRLDVDGAEAGELTYAERGDHAVAFLHTEVDPELQGGGLGSTLVEAALADARERGLEVVPVCPFVVAHLRRHPS